MNLQVGATSPAEVSEGMFLRRHPSVLLLVLACTIVTILILWIGELERSRQERVYQQQLAAAESQITRIATSLADHIRRASLTIEREVFLSGALSEEKPFSREEIEAVFRSFIQDQPLIAQIRWLDESGMERARINRRLGEDGHYDFPAAEILQNKSQRNYFIEAGKLDPGEFYNSHLSLNREFDQITTPLQPVIRTATKTHEALGQMGGVLLINFDLSSTIQQFHHIAKTTGVDINIQDAVDGRVYVSTEYPELAFAHELGKSSETLWDRFPDRRTTNLAFMASDKVIKRTPYEVLIRGWIYSAADRGDKDDLERHVWSRGGRVNMSPGGLLFDLRIPSSRVADDLRNKQNVLIFSLLAVGSLIAIFVAVSFGLEHKNLMALREARNLAAAKSQFLANMSHEIRTPITGIIGMLDLIEVDTESPENKEKIQFVKRSTQSLRQIIDDILDITKLQNNRIELKPAPFNPADTVETVIQLYSASARQKGIDLTASTSPGIADIVVNGDEFRIEQVLNNLVSNAIKFTETGNVTLELSVSPLENHRVRLGFTVADTGIGIKPELIAHLGEPFFQVDASNTRKFGGTGLGLSICNRLLALMDSRLEIASRCGSGTTVEFDIELPLAEPEDNQREEKDLRQGESQGDRLSREAMEEILKARVRLHGPPRVLVVEDSSSMQLLIEAIFQSLDIPITLAGHGKAAVQMVGEHKFDLVFMDLQMPEMGGVEATGLIRTRLGPEALPIIILSATVQDREIQEGLSAGANHYLGKPIDMDDLLAALLRFWQPSADIPG